MSTAWIFGGHGVQYVNMGRDVLAQTAAGRGWLDAAEQATGLPLARLSQQGPARALADPRVLEPLLAAVSGAHADLLHDQDGPPDAVSGYSAGMLAAAYAAGAIDQATCLAIACSRGEALARAAGQLDGGMVSASGLCDEQLFDIAERAGDDLDGPVTVAAHNAPRHVVYAGTRAALQRATALAHAAGARTAPLEVAGPWHTPLLQAAAHEIAAAIRGLRLRAPRVPVWCSLSTRAGRDPDLLRLALATSVASPIRWHATVQAMRADGVNDFVEVSPGRALWALLGQQPPPHDFTRAYVESPQGRLRRPVAPAVRPAGRTSAPAPGTFQIDPHGMLPAVQAAA